LGYYDFIRIVTGLLAGSRPAFYLSSFNPVKVLKGSTQTGTASALPRKVLVVLQFSCSIALIIGTIIIYKQLLYAKDRPTGYNKDLLITTDIHGDLKNHYQALKNDLFATGIVENVAFARLLLLIFIVIHHLISGLVKMQATNL